MAKNKTKSVEWSVADALDNGKSELTALCEELQEWYDNLPENFQNGTKGDQLQTAIDALSNADQTDVCDSMANSADEDDEATKGYVGGLRFTFSASTKKRQSRADRCSEATSLMRAAIECVEEAIGEAFDDEKDDPYTETRDEIESNIDELTNIIDEAEGVEFPGMYS